MNYDLSRLATPPRGKKKTLLPQISESLRAEQAYLKIERKMLLEMRNQIRDELIPEAEREAARTRQTTDAMSESLWESVRALALSLAGTASRMVDRVLSLESQRHTSKFIEAAQKALGVDLRAVVRQQDLDDLLSAVSIRNAALIRDLSQETVAKIAQKVTSSVLAGQGHQFLRTQIKEVFEVSDSRAKLIARDQTAKLNSDLNRFRQSQAGVDKYVWRTSMDERVRPRHKGLEGNTYEWGEPTGAEEGLPPGQPVQCRCVAQGIVEF
jgi:SPP1 gp7 family putative phage head morphogenesis protein